VDVGGLLEERDPQVELLGDPLGGAWGPPRPHHVPDIQSGRLLPNANLLNAKYTLRLSEYRENVCRAAHMPFSRSLSFSDDPHFFKNWEELIRK